MFSHYLRHMLLIERVKLLPSTLQTVLLRLLRKLWASLVSPKSKQRVTKHFPEVTPLPTAPDPAV